MAAAGQVTAQVLAANADNFDRSLEVCVTSETTAVAVQFPLGTSPAAPVIARKVGSRVDRMNKERRTGPGAQKERQPFGSFVRLSMRSRLIECRAHDSHWSSGPNIAWVRWPRDDGRYVFAAIRRRRDWLTGELGIANDPVELDELVEVKTVAGLRMSGTRISLGFMTSGHDQWWTTGGNEQGFLDRLDWLSQQLKLRLHTLNNVAEEDAA